jgi:hypothetical protein
VNRALLDAETEPYFRRLRVCLIEVARRKQVVPDSLPVGEVQLSWTILPDGTASDVTAVAAADADGDVLHCIGQRMFGWRFTPVEGGAAHVTYRVTVTRSQPGNRLVDAGDKADPPAAAREEHVAREVEEASRR